MSKTSKLEYTDEPDAQDETETELLETPPVAEVKPPSIKKARSDAQKATTAKMRLKLEERRNELVIIKQEAKATALLQQEEMKSYIKQKLIKKQIQNKASEKMKQMILDEEDSDEEDSEAEEVVVVAKTRRPISRSVNSKQLPSARSSYPPPPPYQFPTVNFV